MRNITYCYVFHRQRAKLRLESVLIPFISCKGNHKHETFLQSSAMCSPEAFLTQNRDVSSFWCCAAFRQVTAPPVLGTRHGIPSKDITSVYLNFSPLWPVWSSSPANVPLSNLTWTCWSGLGWFGLRKKEEKCKQALQYSFGRRELKLLILLPPLWISSLPFPSLRVTNSTIPQMNGLKSNKCTFQSLITSVFLIGSVFSQGNY